ncbi:Ig-like domain-containing protein, partial [Stappia sp.]|uniref:LysM peptidoglycan-binding domain-containing protein n=1 Tax=Stappia sp. TaxID=1870903 RepID=UPI003A9A615B
ASAGKVPSFDLMRVEKDGSTVVAGQSEAGAIVALLSNGKVVGKGIANASGEFAIVLDEPLAPGAHAVTLEIRDQSGATLGTSTQSMAVSVPETPEGDVLVLLNEPGAPSQVLQKPQIADVGAPVAGGTAGSTATGDGATTVADAGPAAGGNAQPAAPVASAPQDSAATTEGGEPARAAQTDTAATGTQTAGAPVDGTQPGATGEAPAAASTATQTADAGSAATAPEQPAASSAAPAGAPAGAPSTVTGAPAAGEGTGGTSAPVTVEAVETEKDKVFVAGAGEPNSDVRVYVDNKLVGEAKTDSGGRWLLETQGEVKPGEVAVRADQVKPGDGAVVARAEVTFEKEADAIVLRPVALTGTAGAGSGDSASTGTRAIPSIIIRTGDNLWTISQRRYGEGLRYTTIYQANKDQIRNPDLIYPGQVFMMPEGDRNWPQAPSSGG